MARGLQRPWTIAKLQAVGALPGAYLWVSQGRPLRELSPASQCPGRAPHHVSSLSQGDPWHTVPPHKEHTLQRTFSFSTLKSRFTFHPGRTI